MNRFFAQILSLAVCLVALGCVAEPAANNPATNSNTSTSPSPALSASPSPVAESKSPAQPLTLPVLDAFFADESSSGLLKTRLQLTGDEVTKLKEMAQAETVKLNEASAGNAEGESAAARAQAEEKISALIGAEKTQQLTALLGEWSSSGPNESSSAAPAKQDIRDQNSAGPNAVPTDTRIVVNAPAYRMDVFDGGRLIKSYKIGIGYPQFPLPSGLRKAREIIFNPTWTPPDEPWVAKMKDVSPGEKVEAGSKLNPLGPIKIPIGGPSLIHGGKSPAKLGTFASHGCVGLTTPQVQDFAKVLAQLAGTQITDADVAAYARDKTQTKHVKLGQPVPVELRYETIVVEDGKLHIYRDVYDRGTNTEENLRAVLAANDLRLEDLPEAQRTEISSALAQMSGKSAARTDSLAKDNSRPESSKVSSSMAEKKATPEKTSRINRNRKEVVIEIAALAGKGYPAPLALDNGRGKSKVAPSKAKSATRP